LSARQPPPSDAVPPGTLLTESEVRAVLAVQALEEADPEGARLARAERERASDRARDEDERLGPFLAARADALLPAVDRTLPGFARLRRAAGLDLAPLWIVGPALLLGVATNLVGAEKRISLLANPLAGLILWNLAVYALVLVAHLRAGRRTNRARGPARLAGLATRLATWRSRGGNRGELNGRVAAAYLSSWTRSARPLLATRLARALHLGAAAMALGALAGMYVRGLLLEYRVTWESTFLGPAQVEAWLALLLGPATLVPGLELPGPEVLERIRAPESGEAALWIHLYAGSTVLLVVLPRLLLALQASWAGRGQAAALRLDTGSRYYQRILAGARGAGVHATVIPYSYTPGAAHVDRLKALLHEVLGAHAAIDLTPSPAYGTTSEELPLATEARVLLFNLAQTPEAEVHGRLLESLAGTHTPLLVLVDAAGWRERAGGEALDDKLAERRRTWDRIARGAGAQALHVDLDRPAPDALVERCRAALERPLEEEPTP
jgi:hypothetical protein